MFCFYSFSSQKNILSTKKESPFKNFPFNKTFPFTNRTKSPITEKIPRAEYKISSKTKEKSSNDN